MPAGSWLAQALPGTASGLIRVATPQPRSGPCLKKILLLNVWASRLAVGQHPLYSLFVGLVHKGDLAKAHFPAGRLLGEDMPQILPAPSELARSCLLKPFCGCSPGFYLRHNNSCPGSIVNWAAGCQPTSSLPATAHGTDQNCQRRAMNADAFHGSATSFNCSRKDSLEGAIPPQGLPVCKGRLLPPWQIRFNLR